MIELSRRRLLTGTAAAATAATAFGPLGGRSPARAAAPMAGKQAPGFYRYKVGSFELTVISDGARSAPVPDTYVKNAKREEFSAGFAGLYMDKDKPTAPFNTAVVNTGAKLVAIDTGLGPQQYEQSKGAVGQAHTNLAAAGIDRGNVDVVIISHFHGDHINGLLTADSKPAFANAEVMVPAAEWKFWMDDANMAKAAAGSPLEGNFKNVRRVFGALGNKVTQYEPDKELVAGITSLATYGHTPGHTSHRISSGSAQAIIQADVTAHVAELFTRNPGWHAMFDMDGGVAEATRRKLYDMVATDRIPLQGYHFPLPAVGYIEKSGAGYRWVPVAWNPTL
jgi:glyoxylase-like metal-dependent hydrolase (beta-lactamase superfamily II)